MPLKCCRKDLVKSPEPTARKMAVIKMPPKNSPLSEKMAHRIRRDLRHQRCTCGGCFKILRSFVEKHSVDGKQIAFNVGCQVCKTEVRIEYPLLESQKQDWARRN